MTPYMFSATYSRQGIQGILIDGGVSRIGVLERLGESLGGRLEVAYWAFGDTDSIAIASLAEY